MATETDYDTLGQPVAGNDGNASFGGNIAFSFTSGATDSTLSDVKLSVEDGSATTDQGSFEVLLLADEDGAPGGQIADLGTVDDTQIDPSTSTVVDVPVTATVPLTANTRYWIEVTGSLNSDVNLDYETDASGTGAANEFFAEGGQVSSNAQNGAFIAQVTDSPTCFAAGTRIRTERGDVAVEDLVIGDRVVTASGETRPVRWLGHRTIDCRRHPHQHEVMPIGISAHAFGENRPARDLFVSAGHAICVDILGEVLIPAGALVNGATIQQVEVDEVTYWHVELDSHDVLLAENLAAESYLDMGNRAFFREGDVVALAAGPDADPSRRTHADFCRPFHAAGALVDVVRAQLAKRAESSGWSLERAVEMHLEVDGQPIAPQMRGLVARFDLPAGAKDVWLVSPTTRPSDCLGTGDRRDLGLCLGALEIDDGFDTREIALDDPLLRAGFHELEDGIRRWTSGRARLPAALWEGFGEGAHLRIKLAAAPLPRWIAPTSPGQRSTWLTSRTAPRDALVVIAA